MKKSILYFGLSFLIFSVSSNVGAQTDNVKEKVETQTNNRANNKVDQGINDGLNAAESGVKNLFKKKKTAGDQPQEQNSEQPTEQEATKGETTSDEPSLQTYSKFDFIPGERVVFYEDFTQDAIGDFPALWNTNGSGEVVNTNLYPGNWLRYVMDESIWTDKLLALPDNYTLEFDVVPIEGTEGGMGGWSFRLMKAINEKSWDGGAVPGKAGFQYGVEYFGRSYYRAYNNALDGEFWDQKGYKDDENTYQKKDQKYHMSVWVQKTRIRIYQNETKMFDVPRAFPDAALKMDRIRFEANAAMVSNIHIAVGAPDTRNKLMTEGKLVTYGIYFDVNKDVVKPESYGTLKEIATILNEVPDVQVKIVGHTDAEGADAANLDLSKRRAESVKAELVKSFGVNGDRLVTDGMGEGQPVAPNDSPVNKALNRRVEFIKL
ncbi:MAG: OmpA family protein [Cyclobacteriaceae bacterium]|nr:OmpA family protein [Cyclobacteriaceae bacterium]